MAVYFDTHIHLQDYNKTAPKTLLDNLRRFAVVKCICVSSREQEWEKTIQFARMFPRTVVPALAVHPWHAGETSAGWAGRLEHFLNLYPSALIGECGLDRLKNPSYEEQAEVFAIQTGLARKYNRTLLIHAVKAQEWLHDFWQSLPDKFVFHSFNARAELLHEVIKHGGYVAFNRGILRNRDVIRILTSVPRNRLLFESDAPYQSRPEDIPLLCREIAAIRREDTESLAEAVYENSLQIAGTENFSVCMARAGQKNLDTPDKVV